MKYFIDVKDGIKIIFLAICTNLFSEFMSWLLIYRKKEYKDNKRVMDSLTKKIEINKESLNRHNKKIEKKIKQQENDLKLLNFEMVKIKFLSMIIISVLMFFFMRLLNGIFQGVIVAKIPFVPFKLLRGISHRNILTHDFTDCSFTFLYILCNISFRPIIQKLLGFAPPRNSNKMPDYFGLEDNKQ